MAALLSRLAALPAAYVLTALVAVSAATRWVASLGHTTPTYFPDEWVYSALARGIAATGRPVVHGEPSTFPALLEPLLAAPAWLADPATALRIVQALHSLEMSLAAVPVYLLARRLGAGSGISLAAAAVALAGPGLVFASFLTADALGYLLALTAVYLGVRALDRPTAGAQLLFLSAAGLATFARVQYAFLPLAFLGAALVVEGGRPLRALARFRVAATATGAALAAAVALAPSRLLGSYWSFPEDWYAPAPLLRWLVSDAFLLAYSAGWVLVPGAAVALVLMAARPRSRVERAFAALSILCVAALLLEAAAIAAIESDRFHERYLLVLPPLLAVAFASFTPVSRRARYAVAAVALGLLVASVRVPLTAYTAAQGTDDSPTLWAAAALEGLVGKANGSLAFAGAAALLSLAAVLVAYRPRVGAPAALALAAAIGVGLSVTAHGVNARSAAYAREALLPPDARWVDRAGLGDVGLVQTPLSRKPGALSHLFWNRSITHVIGLEGTDPLDTFAAFRTRIADDGRLVARGRTLEGPLLVNRFATQVELTGAERAGEGGAFELWRPRGTPRVSLLAIGWYVDRWLGHRGELTVFADPGGSARGTLRLTLSLPEGYPANELAFRAPGVRRSVAVHPGGTAEVAFRFDQPGPWKLEFRAANGRFDSMLRMASVLADVRLERD